MKAPGNGQEAAVAGLEKAIAALLRWALWGAVFGAAFGALLGLMVWPGPWPIWANDLFLQGVPFLALMGGVLSLASGVLDLILQAVLRKPMAAPRIPRIPPGVEDTMRERFNTVEAVAETRPGPQDGMKREDAPFGQEATKGYPERDPR